MEDNDADTLIFQSGDKFYLWDELCNGVDEIASRDIHETAGVLSQEGLKKLQRRRIDPIHDLPP